MVVAMIFATNVVAEESIDRTQPYQMMTQVSEVAFNRLKAEQENIKQALLKHLNLCTQALFVVGAIVARFQWITS